MSFCDRLFSDLFVEGFHAIFFYSRPNRKPNRPHEAPPTSRPEGRYISAAPILDSIINETMKK
jgi:hypothetical protein